MVQKLTVELEWRMNKLEELEGRLKAREEENMQLQKDIADLRGIIHALEVVPDEDVVVTGVNIGSGETHSIFGQYVYMGDVLSTR